MHKYLKAYIISYQTNHHMLIYPMRFSDRTILLDRGSVQYKYTSPSYPEFNSATGVDLESVLLRI